MGKADFTFFPAQNEQQLLAEADVETLSQICQGQPDMAGRFLHELYRTGRVEELATLTAKFRAGELDSSAAMLDIVMTSIPIMNECGVSEEDSQAFIAEVMPMLIES